jgi:hypothetical protein
MLSYFEGPRTPCRTLTHHLLGYVGIHLLGDKIKAMKTNAKPLIYVRKRGGLYKSKNYRKISNLYADVSSPEYRTKP